MIIFQAIFWISLLLIVYVYFLYPIVLYGFSIVWIFRSTGRSGECPIIGAEKKNNLPSVSIIIAAYNEEAYIERKIKNFFSLDYPKDKLEIIIGSDGSDDKTNEIIKKYVDKGILFLSYFVRRGKMAVVNDCVQHAKGEICVFSDVSEIFETDAVKKIVRNFAIPDIGAVTGNHLYNPSETGLGKGTHIYWRYQRWLQRLESQVATILSCDGTIYACRRHLFIPPPEGTINDDKAVPMEIVRQGYRVIFEPEAIARGDVLPETRAFFRQKVRGQAGMYQIFHFFKDMFLPKKFMVWFIFMSHTVGPVMVPWFLLIVLLSNLPLVDISFYKKVFIFQLVFYSSAMLGGICQYCRFRFPLIHLPYFLVVSNVASLVGCCDYLFKGQKKAKWKKVE